MQMKASEAIVNLYISPARELSAPNGSTLEFQGLAPKGSGPMLADTDKLIFLDYCASVSYILTGKVHHRSMS